MPRRNTARKKDLTTPAWEFNGTKVTSPPDGTFGFVYLIENLRDGKLYIGRKQFFSTNRKRVAGRVNRKRVVKESNWKSYWSSCDELCADVARLGTRAFRRRILCFCTTKGELGFRETEALFKNDVLTATRNGRLLYYNRNIMNRWFAKEPKES